MILMRRLQLATTYLPPPTPYKKRYKMLIVLFEQKFGMALQLLIFVFLLTLGLVCFTKCPEPALEHSPSANQMLF
jgi:hypothetical protein